jgi:hypothetical protein
MIPIELKNGCSETNCEIDSDDITLTNLVRIHYLQHFGHRDLDGICSMYSPASVMINVINNERRSYHSPTEIRTAFQEIFHLHPTVTSTFELKQILIQQKTATIQWEAQTPTHLFTNCQDKFVFSADNKIVKQFFTCTVQDLDTPWYITDE